MKQMVRTVAVFVLLTIIFVMFSCGNTVSAQSYTSEDGLYRYQVLEDGTACLESYKGSDADIVLPSQVDGYTVTGLYFKFQYNRTTHSITIPETLVNFGSEAHSLVYAYVEEFRVAPNHPLFTTKDGVLFNKDQTVLMRYPANKGTSYTVPDGVIEIGVGAFGRCENMTSVTLPQGVRHIGQNAFYYCRSLSDINIPSSVSSFGDSAFEVTKALSEFVVPDGVTHLSNGMFLGSGVKDVYIPDSVTSFGNEVFSYVTATIHGSRGSAAEQYVNDPASNNLSAKLSFAATDPTTAAVVTTSAITTTSTAAVTTSTAVVTEAPATTTLAATTSHTTAATVVTTAKSATSTTVQKQTTTTLSTVDTAQPNKRSAVVWWIIGGVLLTGAAAGLGYFLYRKHKSKP